MPGTEQLYIAGGGGAEWEPPLIAFKVQLFCLLFHFRFLEIEHVPLSRPLTML